MEEELLVLVKKAIILLSFLLVIACSAEKKEVDQAVQASGKDLAERTEVAQKKAEEANDKSFKEISAEWKDKQLSKSEFDKLVKALNKPDADNLFEKVSFKDGNLLEFTLKNSEGASLQNKISSGVFNTVMRAMYVKSDYYKNDQQPIIRFIDQSGTVVGEFKDKLAEKTEDPKATKSNDKVSPMGAALNLKDWEMNVESFEFNKAVSDKMFSSSADEGNKYLILSVSVTNNGTSADRFMKIAGGTGAKVIYNDKYEYVPSITMIDGDLSKQSVQPLSTAKGFIVFKVPDKVAEAPESMVAAFQIDKEKVSVKLR